MTFAMLLPVLLMCAGMGIDYARAVSYRTRLQQAADATALAAASAARNEVEQTEVEALAGRVFLANMGDNLGSFNAPTVAISTSGTTVTAEVNVVGKTPTSLTRIFDNEKVDLAVTAVAKAEIGPTTSMTVGGNLSGDGGIYGDPHFQLYGQTDHIIDCDVGKWYTALSDGGLQWNVMCEIADGYGKVYTRHKVIVGGHVVTFDAASLQYAISTLDTFSDDYPFGFVMVPGAAWPSKVTIEGDVMDYDTSMPVMREMLNDAAKGVKISLQGSLHAMPSAYVGLIPPDHYNFVAVIVETAHYRLVMTHAQGAAMVDIQARNAGMCGVPGGIWGQLLGTTTPDTTPSTFEVADADVLYPQYAWTPTCGPLGSSSTARLVR